MDEVQASTSPDRRRSSRRRSRRGSKIIDQPGFSSLSPISSSSPTSTTSTKRSSRRLSKPPTGGGGYKDALSVAATKSRSSSVSKQQRKSRRESRSVPTITEPSSSKKIALLDTSTKIKASGLASPSSPRIKSHIFDSPPDLSTVPDSSALPLPSAEPYQRQRPKAQFRGTTVLDISQFDMMRDDMAAPLPTFNDSPDAVASSALGGPSNTRASTRQKRPHRDDDDDDDDDDGLGYAGAGLAMVSVTGGEQGDEGLESSMVYQGKKLALQESTAALSAARRSSRRMMPTRRASRFVGSALSMEKLAELAEEEEAAAAAIGPVSPLRRMTRAASVLETVKEAERGFGLSASHGDAVDAGASDEAASAAAIRVELAAAGATASDLGLLVGGGEMDEFELQLAKELAAVREGIPVGSMRQQKAQKIDFKLLCANERTFLQWLNLCLWIGMPAMGFLTFGTVFGQIVGVILLLECAIFTYYSKWQFSRRQAAISVNNKSFPFEDKHGPSAIAVAFFLTYFTITVVSATVRVSLF